MPKVEKETQVTEPAEKQAPVKIVKKKRMKHKGIATFFIIVAGIALLSVGLELVVTARTQDVIAAQVDASLNPVRVPSVTLSMHPILYKYFAGRIDQLKIEAEDFRMKYGTVVETATIDLRGLKFDPMEMAQSRQISAIKSVDSGTARIVLSEEAVNILVGDRLPGGTVKLEKGAFRYTAEMPYVLPGVTISALGNVIVMPDNTLRFQPNPGELENMAIPQDIKDYLISALAVDYKLEDIPSGIEISKVTIDTGRLTIFADITDISFLSTGVTGVKD